MMTGWLCVITSQNSLLTLRGDCSWGRVGLLTRTVFCRGKHDQARSIHDLARVRGRNYLGVVAVCGETQRGARAGGAGGERDSRSTTGRARSTEAAGGTGCPGACADGFAADARPMATPGDPDSWAGGSGGPSVCVGGGGGAGGW